MGVNTNSIKSFLPGLSPGGEGVLPPLLRIVYPFIASYLDDCVRLRELLEVIVEVMLGDIEVMHKSLEDVWSIDMVLIPKLYS